MKAHKQTTDGQSYTTGYAYNLSGAMIEQTYPSGRVVKNTLDGNGALQQVQSKCGSTHGVSTLCSTYRNYANGFTYTAAGAVSAMRLGNGRWESTELNARLQPVKIGLGTSAADRSLLKIDYEYGEIANGVIDPAKNNVNLARQTVTVPANGGAAGFTAVQKYEYGR